VLGRFVAKVERFGDVRRQQKDVSVTD